MARHVPRDRGADFAPPRRAGGPKARFHHPRRRRPDPAAQAAPRSREYRREALARASFGLVDRRLEESRPHPRAGAGGRSRRLRQRQGFEALQGVPGAAENPQRRRFRRPAAGEHPAVPRAARSAAPVPEPLQVHPGRRIPGHQRRPVSLAAAVGAADGRQSGDVTNITSPQGGEVGERSAPGEGDRRTTSAGPLTPTLSPAGRGGAQQHPASSRASPSQPKTSAASATTTSRSTAGAAPRSTTSCASSTISPAPR